MALVASTGENRLAFLQAMKTGQLGSGSRCTRRRRGEGGRGRTSPHWAPSTTCTWFGAAALPIMALTKSKTLSGTAQFQLD